MSKVLDNEGRKMELYERKTEVLASATLKLYQKIIQRPDGRELLNQKKQELKSKGLLK